MSDTLIPGSTIEAYWTNVTLEYSPVTRSPANYKSYIVITYSDNVIEAWPVKYEGQTSTITVRNVEGVTIQSY